MANTAPLTAALVDQIGALKAQLAPQLAVLKLLEDKLKAEGLGRYLGHQFEANVFEQERNTLDTAACRAKLSPQFVAAHTTTSISTILKVTARQLNLLRAA